MSAGEDFKSSAHVWGGGPEEPDTIVEAPPAYSGIEPDPSSPRPDLPARPSRRRVIPRETYHPIQAIAKWAKVPWGRYIAPDATVSADKTTITTSHSAYFTSQQALLKLLADQAELPPIPCVRIRGAHIQASNHVQKLDFDITLNLSSLLDLTKTPRWNIKPAHNVPLQNASGTTPASFQVHGSSNGQIESLARQFIRDKSDRKSFILNRSVENLPTDVIEGLVRNLIASVNYRGKVHVAFPVQSGQLVVQRKSGGTGGAVGGWFMNVLGLSPEVKYESLERVWAIGSPAITSSSANNVNVVEEDEEDEAAAADGGHGAASALIKEWWNAWAPVIRDSILLKKMGKIGIEDWIEAQMGWRPQAPTRDWGADYM